MAKTRAKKVTKKAPAKKKSTAKKGSKSVADIAPMRMRGKLYWEFKAAFAEMMEARASHENMRIRVEAEKTKQIYKPLVLLMNESDAAHRHMVMKQGEFSAVQTQVAKKFNIPQDEILQWSFDTETGIVYPPGETPKKQHSLV